MIMYYGAPSSSGRTTPARARTRGPSSPRRLYYTNNINCTKLVSAINMLYQYNC